MLSISLKGHLEHGINVSPKSEQRLHVVLQGYMCVTLE